MGDATRRSVDGIARGCMGVSGFGVAHVDGTVMNVLLLLILITYLVTVFNLLMALNRISLSTRECSLAWPDDDQY
jgi:hypothetical protein